MSELVTRSSSPSIDELVDAIVDLLDEVARTTMEEGGPPEESRSPVPPRVRVRIPTLIRQEAP